MAVAGRVIHTNGLFCILKLSCISSLPCHPLYIRYGDGNDDMIFDEYAVSLGFIGLDLKLLNRVDKLATEVKSRREERLEFITCGQHGGSLCNIEDCLQEHMELYLVDGLGFGAV